MKATVGKQLYATLAAALAVTVVGIVVALIIGTTKTGGSLIIAGASAAGRVRAWSCLRDPPGGR